MSAKIRMCVDDAFVLFEVWIGIGCSLRIELRDLLRQLAGLIPPIDERYLRQHEQDEKNDEYALEGLHLY